MKEFSEVRGEMMVSWFFAAILRRQDQIAGFPSDDKPPGCSQVLHSWSRELPPLTDKYKRETYCCCWETCPAVIRGSDG